jgi:hypothetical protein
MNQLESLEARVVLSNGLVGVPGQFAPPTHNVNITSIPQDPDNDGVVSGTALTIIGNVERPDRKDFTDTHTPTITIDALAGTAVVGSVTWNTANPGPPEFYQDPAAPYRALFQIPVTLASTPNTPQNLTFRVTVAQEGYGTLPFTLRGNPSQPLTGTFTIDTTAPTLNPLPAIPKRDTPLPSASVSFSEAINPATFLVTSNPATSNVTLEWSTPAAPTTRTQIPLDPAVVQITSTDNTNFTISGLETYTAIPRLYRLSVVGKPAGGSTIADAAGNAIGGTTTTQRVTFEIAPGPWVAGIGPAAAPSTDAVDSLRVVFSEPIQAGSFTTAALTLQALDWATFVNGANPGTPTNVPIPAGATITKVDDTTYRVDGLAPATANAGNYYLTVDPSAVRDLSGNAFIGNVSYLFNVLPDNGVVGAAAGFKSSPTTTAPHHVLFTEITQDGNNDGVVNTQNLTFKGQVWRPEPGEGDFTPPEGSHVSITITAYQQNNTGAKQEVGKIVWEDTALPDPEGNFTQGTGANINTAYFTMPVGLLSGAPARQDVTFEISVSRNGTPGLAPVVYWQDIFDNNNLHPLAATMVVDATGPVVTELGPVTSPRNTPVSTVGVTFSEPIDAATFTAEDLALTFAGSPAALDPGVAIVQVSPTQFTITGLDANTTAEGTYLLVVDTTGIRDALGNPGTGTEEVAFEVDTTAPEILAFTEIESPRTEPLDSVDVQFSKPINPDSLTLEDITLLRDGQPVALGDDVTITPASGGGGATFTIGNLAAYTGEPGTYELIVDAAGVDDLAGNAGTGDLSTSFVVEPSAAVGPQVTNLRRFGFHAQPTKLVLNFNAPLDAATAQNAAAYQVVGAGRDRLLGTGDDVVYRLRRQVYDAATGTVTLVTAQRLFLFTSYRITVKGTGSAAVLGADGAPLDGNGTGGQGGSDYVANFNRSILAGAASKWPIGNPTPVRRPMPRGVTPPVVVTPTVPKVTLAKPARRGR